jgi:hypothetical protein
MNLTLNQLIEILSNIAKEGHGDEAVFLSSETLKGNTSFTAITHLSDKDISITKNLQHSSATIYSDFDKGIVIGFLPTID